MAHVSHKLGGALEGALAGGGDPATSPLYVFGPFLKLIVAAGVAEVTFGASIWLAVITVAMVSAMYRLVMRWVTDGSGGSGLCEEEFGAWAVKLNAGITFIEYTLTFLVSMAALVTFLADRASVLEETLLGLPLRALVAVGLSVLVALAVNRGPRVAARAFGPATAAILVLLWVLVGATIWKRGLALPGLDLHAFDRAHLGITLGGYARILALMTGIEIFANLVAAYRGPARSRSRKAFGSLVIIMGTTVVTMLVVGPAIHDLSDPMDPHVSVFTQTMDRLLPAPLPWVGTIVGVAVLLSAAAASAQGIQNLALGLRFRNYLPAWFGQRNRFGVAAAPVWVEVGVCVTCFVALGTDEERYLALYAAGVFILLSLTGWAVVKRLARETRADRNLAGLATLGGAALAALLTSGATALIFEERFTDGAWIYLAIVPLLYVGFGHCRRKLAAPQRVEDRVGRLVSASTLPTAARPDDAGLPPRQILVPLDTSPHAEHALPIAALLARAFGSRLRLLTASPTAGAAAAYLASVQAELTAGGCAVETLVRDGVPDEVIGAEAQADGVDAVVMTTDGRSRLERWLAASVTARVIYQTTPPLYLVRPTEAWTSIRTRCSRLLVALDGSAIAEQVLPHVPTLADRFQSEVVLFSAKEGSESDAYAPMLGAYLERIATGLRTDGLSVRTLVAEGAPALAILQAAHDEGCDLIMMVSHGRGGVARQEHVKLGSVVDTVLQQTTCPVLLISARPDPESSPTR